ncbi:MAG: hypothetical protein ABSH19_00770 [Opitutales bacterium]
MRRLAPWVVFGLGLIVGGTNGVLADPAPAGNATAAGNGSAAPAPSYSEKQLAALQGITQAECAASAALAGEDWGVWVKAKEGLFVALGELQKQFGYGGFQGAIQTAVQGWPDLGKATDLTHARSAYVKVSDALAQVVLQARAGDPDLAKVMIYYCPMTTDPANGKWVQSAAPLRNPFWGKDMLDCGSEVKQ